MNKILVLTMILTILITGCITNISEEVIIYESFNIPDDINCEEIIYNNGNGINPYEEMSFIQYHCIKELGGEDDGEN